MDQNLDLGFGKLKNLVSLYEFKPLVHHGCRVDRYLCSHVPVRMSNGLGQSHVRHCLDVKGSERSTRYSQNHPFDRVTVFEIEDLKDRIMLRINGKKGAAA